MEYLNIYRLKKIDNLINTLKRLNIDYIPQDLYQLKSKYKEKSIEFLRIFYSVMSELIDFKTKNDNKSLT